MTRRDLSLGTIERIALVPMRALAALLVGLMALTVASAAAAQPAPAGPTTVTTPKVVAFTGEIAAVGPRGTSITIKDVAKPLSVPDPAAQALLAQAHPGDTVHGQTDDALAPTTMNKVNSVTRPVDAMTRAITLVVSLLVLLLLAAIVTRFRPQDFLIGVDGKYSNSQVQLTLWFGVVAVVYASAVVLRIFEFGWDYVGGVGVTENLILLTGLSAFTFGGAKVIASQKAASAAAAAAAPPVAPVAGAAAVPAAPAPAPVAPVSAAPASLVKDLVSNAAGAPDLGDFQMILITLAAVVIFAVNCFVYLGRLPLEAITTLPDVDTTLLSAFGLGQGAYLIKKAALPPNQG
ncbi:MAG: hypothetical protein JSR45_08675 [Proteobacteria bacterium]|nr:hypothetical protein [Pseudomonadota bacterium]